MEYALVRFTEEDGAPGIIATNWITDNGSNCWFPNVKTEEKKQKLLLSRATPEQNWIQCPIRILKEFRSYQYARAQLSEAEETSNLESADDEFVKRRIRKRKVIQLPGEDSSEEEEVHSRKSSTSKHLYIDPYPAPPTSVQAVYDHHQNNIALTSNVKGTPSTPIVLQASGWALKNATQGEIPLPSPSSSIDSAMSGNSTEFQQLKTNQAMMWNVLHEFSDNVKNVDSKLDLILTIVQAQPLAHQTSEVNADSNEDLNFLSSLPAQTNDEFLELNKRVADSTAFKQKLTKILAVVGGRDAKALTCNILRKLVIDDLAQKYSLTGKPVKNGPRKGSFEKTEVYKLLVDICARTHKNVKEPIIREGISDWLMQAKFRNERKLVRMQKHMDKQADDEV